MGRVPYGGIGRVTDVNWAGVVYNGDVMDQCPICGGSLEHVLVVCGQCGEMLPLRVVVVSEGSHGGGFAVVAEEQGRQGEGETGRRGDKETRRQGDEVTRSKGPEEVNEQ